MIVRLIRKIKLKLYPLKKGEVLYGDCLDFNIGSILNQVRHGLRSPEGDLKYTFWYGENTYRITIVRTCMPYYVFDAEVLTKSIDDNGQFVWKKRHMANRVMKSKINDMILTGKLTRSKT